MAQIWARRGHWSARFEVGDRVTIGRHPGCEVAIEDPTISRQHAVLERSSAGWVLTDLGSRHGTFVGGARTISAEIKPHQPFRAGDTILVIEDQQDTRNEPRMLAVDAKPRFLPAGEVDAATMRRDYERLRATYAVSRAIGVEQGLEPLLDRVLQAVLEILPADRAAIVLQSGVLPPSSASWAQGPDGPRDRLQLTRSRFDASEYLELPRTIIDLVCASKSALISGDAGVDQRLLLSQSIDDTGVRSAVCVPLLYEDEVLGVLHIDTLGAPHAFRPEDVELLTTIGNQAALAIKNAVLRERVSRVIADDRRRLRRVISELPTGLILLDEASRPTEINPAARRIVGDLELGVPVEAIAGASIAELVRRSGSEPAELTLPGPPPRVVLVSAVGSLASSGVDAETVIVLHDVTQAREQEARAAQAERLSLIGRLASGVAHDLNNILCVILTAIGTLEKSAGTAEQEELELVRQATERGAALARQLLTIGRGEPRAAEVVDLGALVSGMRPILERALGSRASLSIRADRSSPRVLVDPGRMEQVLINLVINARDAMPDGGSVVLSIAGRDIVAGGRDLELPPGRYAWLSVADTGTGMSPEVAARAFEPFFTTKAPGKGTGLGLSTVYGFVQQSQGRISVESRSGRGTTFEILLPCAQLAGATADPPSEHARAA